jgi:hypothetical protein
MSGASNLGYENINPLSNVNGQYVNIDNSNYSGRFSSNEIPGTPPGPLPGLAGAKSNVDAAAGKVPGICMSGGSLKKLKQKIKNITKQYKRMKAGSRRIKNIKSRLGSRSFSRNISRSLGLSGGRNRRKSLSGGRNRRKSLSGGISRRISRGRSMRGGYSQYQNNLPMTPSYQVAGINLPASQLGLANPAPITRLSNCVNCVDNFSKNTMNGFPSKGH